MSWFIKRLHRSAAAFALLSAPAAGMAQTPAPDPGKPLVDRLEVAFRACAVQLTQRDHLTPKNATLLRQIGITLRTDPPVQVRAMAARLFGDAGIYAAVTTPVGAMWIAASATVPACKVTLADTPLALTARMGWINRLRTTAGWTYDTARSGSTGAIMRDALVLNRDRPGAHMVVLLDGPGSIADEGRGIQQIMTVAVTP